MHQLKYPIFGKEHTIASKQTREESKHDNQGNLEWQAHYDIYGNKISVSHYNDSGLIRKERYDNQNNLIEVRHYDGKGRLVNHLLLN